MGDTKDGGIERRTRDGGKVRLAARDKRKGPVVYGVLVRGLEGVPADDIKDVFAVCGRVKEVKLTNNGKSILYFEDRAAAGQACRVNGTSYDSRVIRASALSPSVLSQVSFYTILLVLFCVCVCV